jgi:hypothetical protein
VIDRLKRLGCSLNRVGRSGSSHKEYWIAPGAKRPFPIPEYHEFPPNLIKRILLEAGISMSLTEFRAM